MTNITKISDFTPFVYLYYSSFTHQQQNYVCSSIKHIQCFFKRMRGNSTLELFFLHEKKKSTVFLDKFWDCDILTRLDFIFFYLFMSDQPVITEQPLSSKLQRQQPLPKQEEEKKQPQMKLTNSQKFYTLLDGVQQYDALSTKIRKNYQQAMLGLASIKFVDPHSLNVNGHRCTPAFLKINDGQQLEYSYNGFSNKIDEKDADFEQFQDQEQIQETCNEKQLKMNNIKNPQDKQYFCQTELTHRFNVANNHQKIINISKQFKNLIQNLLELHQCKNTFVQTVDQIQKTE